MRDELIKANRAQYKMARGFLSLARTSRSTHLRAECVRMVNVCRGLIARNRLAMKARVAA